MAVAIGDFLKILLPGHAVLAEKASGIARAEETIIPGCVKDAIFIGGQPPSHTIKPRFVTVRDGIKGFL